jgi:hypothetical protein
MISLLGLPLGHLRWCCAQATNEETAVIKPIIASLYHVIVGMLQRGTF